MDTESNGMTEQQGESVIKSQLNLIPFCGSMPINSAIEPKTLFVSGGWVGFENNVFMMSERQAMRNL